MLGFYIVSFVQIVLESLPVSSSGHIHVLELFLKQKYSKELIHLLHVPTLIILAFFFRDTIFWYIKEYAQKQGAFVKLLFFIGIIDSITVLFFIFFNAYNPFKIFPGDVLLVIGFVITGLLLYSL